MTMTEPRHPDIEVYIKNCSLEQILEWLNTRCDSCTSRKSVGGTHAYDVTLNGVDIPVMIHERAVGKAWISIWFRSDATPWVKDLDCAEELSQTLKTQCRCIVSGWNEGDDPDEWWRVENGEQERIQWHTN